MDRRLATQAAHVRSDAWLRERGRAAAAMTQAERLEEACRLGEEAMDWLALQSPETLARLEAARPGLDAAGEDALRRWARGRLA